MKRQSWLVVRTQASKDGACAGKIIVSGVVAHRNDRRQSSGERRAEANIRIFDCYALSGAKRQAVERPKIDVRRWLLLFYRFIGCDQRDHARQYRILSQ